MTMRKYLVTIHEDGSVSALEFEEPADQALTNYQAGARDAVNTIISILETRQKRSLDLAASYREIGDLTSWKHTTLDACATNACIACIKMSYPQCFNGTRR